MALPHQLILKEWLAKVQSFVEFVNAKLYG